MPATADPGSLSGTPSQILAALLRSDPGRPRVTFYEDTPGPTQGERVELSAKVLANWVAKAGNALQDEFDLGPGSRVRLALPPHWRSLYWALAAWTVGATVVVGDAAGDCDLVVTDDAELVADATAPAVLVTLAALARQAVGGAAGAAMDEARQLATYGDQLTPWEEPAPQDVALATPRAATSYADLVPARDWPRGARVHLDADDLATVLQDALAAWAVDGSVVVTRGSAASEVLEPRLAAEGVTHRQQA